MAKQTMGFSSQGINCRADQKLYHLQVRSFHYSLGYIQNIIKKVFFSFFNILSNGYINRLRRPLKPQLCELLRMKNIGLMTLLWGPMQLWQCWLIQGKCFVEYVMTSYWSICFKKILC